MDLNNIHAGINLIKQVLEQKRPTKNEKKSNPTTNNNEGPKTPNNMG